MWSLIPLVSLCAALLSTASPLGNRALFGKHNGVSLSRRFVLSSRFDIPAACVALPSSNMSPLSSDPMTSDNSTITAPPDNSTVIAPPPDNSTVIAPTSTDNSTVIAPPSTDNSTVTAPLSVDNSTVTDNSTLTDGNSTTTSDAADNSTVVRRGGYSDFWDTWFDCCMNSGGDVFDITDPCFSFGLDGLDGLLAVSDVCAQQHTADAMVTFAKSHGVGNSKDLINLAVTYRKMPRESVEIMGFYPSTPYCTVSPVNEELWGIWNEQPEGVTVGLYGGPNYPIVPFGDDSSCPYGQMPDVTTCSCLSSVYTSQSSGLDLTTASSDMSVTSAAIDSTSTDLGFVSVTATVSDVASASATDAASASANATDVASASNTDAVSAVASSTSDASTASASSTADATAAASVENAPSGKRRRYF